jgi:retron-type reverse transcriptase
MLDDTLARAFAAAMLDGPWTAETMAERLRILAGPARGPWIDDLVSEALEEYEEPAFLPGLADWILDTPAFRTALELGAHARHYSLSPPEMAESPWRMPALATHKELATWLGLDTTVLAVLADRRGLSREARDARARHYRYTWIPKRSGGCRLLEAPKSRLKQVQRYVLDDIVARIPPHDVAHGFRPGRSILGFAAPHVGKAVVIRLDLQAFFTSVYGPRVVAMFRSAGYPDSVARTLGALCTHRTPIDVLAAAPTRDASALARLRTPHLPQGAPTSGALANLAAFGLDVRVAALATSIGAQYTRYADDLVVSGARELARTAPAVIARIGAIADEEGFALNFRKTRVMTASERQRITGLVVNARPAIARTELDRLRAILHNCARTGPEPQNRTAIPDFRAHLLGRISWVTAVDARKGARLRTMFDRIRWDPT